MVYSSCLKKKKARESINVNSPQMKTEMKQTCDLVCMERSRACGQAHYSRVSRGQMCGMASPQLGSSMSLLEIMY